MGRRFRGSLSALDCRTVRQHRLTSSLRAGQPGGEVVDPLLHQCLGPQAQVPRRLLSGPAPDRLIGVEVRTVARQVHQLYAEARRRQALPNRLAPQQRGSTRAPQLPSRGQPDNPVQTGINPVVQQPVPRRPHHHLLLRADAQLTLNAVDGVSYCYQPHSPRLGDPAV